MKVKKGVFLSHRVNKRMPLYGGQGRVCFENIKSIKRGDSCNKMLWSFPNHMGTHIDAPLHSIGNGKPVSRLKPRDLIFNKVKLIVFKGIKPGYMIAPNDFDEIVDCDLLLIKTGFENYREKAVYWKNSVCLSPKLGGWLRKRCPSLRSLGIDAISISNLNNREAGRQAHKAFLSRGILLIEDMRLKALHKDPSMVVVAPILVEGADASPCTVLAIDYH